MSCIEPGQPGYDEARVISNSRFDLKPSFICRCANTKDVQAALATAVTHESGLPVRVRSGGHHHEGMCLADEALVVDLTQISHTDFGDDVVSLGPGAQLKDVYAAAEAAGQLFGGGGCGDVRVGGLVQGGGWGPYSRHLGMTCDRLTSVEMVTAKGEVIEVDDASDAKLMAALRGGGGGNFGVVTDFRFRPALRPGSVQPFTMTWDDPKLVVEVVDEWRSNFPWHEDRRLTTFCRLTAVEDGGDDKPVVLGGAFLGTFEELKRLLRELLPKTFDQGDLPQPKTLDQLAPFYQPGPPLAALRQHHGADAAGNLKETCDGTPHRHKVSSSFPKGSFDDGSVQRIAEFLHAGPPTPRGRYYLSLHGMGGAIADPTAPPNSFAFRNYPFMLQYQAWWVSDPALDQESLDWIRRFRQQMAGDTEYAFINFPDKDLAQSRKALLDYYYGPKLKDLIGVKARVDPDNVFDFEMGIPTS